VVQVVVPASGHGDRDAVVTGGSGIARRVRVIGLAVVAVVGVVARVVVGRVVRRFGGRGGRGELVGHRRAVVGLVVLVGRRGGLVRGVGRRVRRVDDRCRRHAGRRCGGQG